MNAADRPKTGMWPTVPHIDPAAVFPLPVGLKLPNGFLQGKPAGIVGMVQGPELPEDDTPEHLPWSDPAADPLADVQAVAATVGHPGLAGPPVPRVPRADWELPGHPVYDLARRVFMIDNSNAPDPAKEWDNAPTAYRDYAFNIAQGLIRAGYGKLPS